MEQEQEIKRIAEHIKEILDPEEIYSIGKHISSGDKFGSEKDLAESILDEGLKFFRKDGVGLTGTVHMKGSTDFLSKLDDAIDSLYKRVDDDLRPACALVAVPGVIKGKDGEEYYLGIYPDDLPNLAKSDKRVRTLPIEKLVRELEKVPPCFILGVFQKYDGKTVFVENPKFISKLDQEKRLEILELFKNAHVSIKTLEKSQKFRKIGQAESISGSTYLSDSAIKYESDRDELRKKLDKEKFQGEQIDLMLEELSKLLEEQDKIDSNGIDISNGVKK